MSGKQILKYPLLKNNEQHKPNQDAILETPALCAVSPTWKPLEYI